MLTRPTKPVKIGEHKTLSWRGAKRRSNLCLEFEIEIEIASPSLREWSRSDRECNNNYGCLIDYSLYAGRTGYRQFPECMYRPPAGT
jgi:hypothetical protein